MEQKIKVDSELVKANLDFLSKVKSALVEIPQGAESVDRKHALKARVLEVVQAMPIGAHISRSKLGDLVGLDMPIGTTRSTSDAIRFNAIKCDLKRDKIWLEQKRAQPNSVGYEYYFTRLK